jgi:hypothetical protein
MPAAFKLRNRSLKSELIFIDSSGGSGGDHQIPRRLEDAGRAEFLPESDVELPAGRAPAHEP